MKTPITIAKTTNEPPQPNEIPKAPAMLIINRDGLHAIYQWVVIRCPFCGKKHYHGRASWRRTPKATGFPSVTLFWALQDYRGISAGGSLSREGCWQVHRTCCRTVRRGKLGPFFQTLIAQATTFPLKQLMQEILVATPLSVSKPYAFASGIAVRSVTPIFWERALAKSVISVLGRATLEETRYWLTVTKEVNDPNRHQDHEELYLLARHAMYATQIIHPLGCNNTYLVLHSMPDGFDNIAVQRSGQMRSTMMGRLVDVEEQGFAEDFAKVFNGVESAFRKSPEGTVRLVNPILLLEHGLQIDNYALSTLFWVMGLDMLFMVGGEMQQFITRISGFLGPDTLVFPRTRYLKMQPKYRVQEVLEDVYKFRNVIAHGAQIPKVPYLQDHTLADTEGQRINHGNYQYAELMRESALFILCKALRKVFMDSLVDEVKDEARWKLRLKIAGRLQAGK